MKVIYAISGIISTALDHSTTYHSIIVPDRDGYKRLELDQIFYIRSDKNYCRIYAIKKDMYFLVRCSMEAFQKRIGKTFCRIHHQYIIPLHQIERPSKDLKTVILKCEEELPISFTYLREFREAACIFF